MTSRQKHKGNKRPRSWHHRGNGPDKAFARAMRKIEKATREVDMEIDLYHRTDRQSAELIWTTGKMLSRENTNEIYFSTRPDGHASGYGDTVIHVRIPKKLAQLEDEFPDGEQHYRVRADKLLPQHLSDVKYG